MAGVLSFALGLETSAFSAALDRAAGRLFGFVAAGKLVSDAVEGVMGAIRQGSALQELSARTGESVSNLFRLQSAFQAVGVSSDAVPGMINRLNKSLSGVGEMGEKTSDAFAALGLSTDDLKKMDAPSQLTAVASRLSQLDRASALDIGSRLFGRDGAGNIMQITRSLDEFMAEFDRAKAAGDVMQHVAAAFQHLLQTIGNVKRNLQGMFAGIAGGIVPTLQGVVDLLQKIDLVALGQKIGTMFAGVFQAFREGKLSKLIADSLVFGFQSGLALVPALFEKLGALLLKVFETPLIYLQTTLEWIIQQAMEKIGKIPGIGKASGLTGFQAQSYGDILADRKATGAEFFTQGNTVENINADANARIAAGLADVQDKWKGLFSEFADFAARGPQLFQGAGGGSPNPGDGKDVTAATAPPKVEATAWEKMGLVFTGGMAMNDPAKQTARHSQQTVELLKITNKLLEKGSAGTLVNAQ